MKTIPCAPAAVVFDFDGTLAKLNIDFVRMKRGVIDLTASYGVPVDGLDRLLVLELIDAVRLSIASRNIGSADGYYREAHDLISAIEIEAAREGALLEGIRGMLAALKKMGIKSGVITRNCRAAVLEIFPDILNFCNAFLPRELTNHVKPHPEHLSNILKALKARPEQAVMVGDHPMDIKTGRDGGLHTVGVLTGYSRREDLERAGADSILASAADIIKIIK